MTANYNNDKAITTLIKEIRNDIETGRLKLTAAVEAQKTTSYWNIGRRIQHHLLAYSDLSNYGHYLFTKLADNLTIGRTTLYQTVQFYNAYPDFDRMKNSSITWGHFKALITIKSPEKRMIYEKIITEKKLTTRALTLLIKENKHMSDTTIPLLTTPPGIPYLYKLITKNTRQVLDLGFRFYISPDLPALDEDTFDENTLVQSEKTNNTYTFRPALYDPVNLYTYKAYITKIIDADTIKVDIDLGFKTTTNQTLRLRGINAYEITTTRGQEAKQFVENALSTCNHIAIKTYHRDKYSRYLTDVYYSDSHKDIPSILTHGRFLNQQLLNNKLAVRYYRY